MHPEFRRAISGISKEHLLQRNERTERDDLEDLVGYPRAERLLADVSPETRKSIEILQAQKQEVMDWLKIQLKRLDTGESMEMLSDASVQLRYSDGVYRMIDRDGQERTVTEGEILTDEVWGITYELSTDAPRSFRKEYLISHAKRRLSGLADRQILLYEIEHSKNEKQKKSYQEILKRLEKSGDIFAWDQGHIAEQMAYNYLFKLSRDWSVPFEILQTDVYEDVTNKIDFVVKAKKETRGIDVEANEESGGIGVQFTLMFRKDSMEGKRRTVEAVLARGVIGEYDIDTIALVNIHPSYVKRAVNKWKKSKGPGGPDACLEIPAKVDLFQKIFESIYSVEELDRYVESVFDVQRKDVKPLKTY